MSFDFIFQKQLYLLFYLSGARLALPMGVAPENIMGCLQPIIGSELHFFDLYNSYFFFSTLS
jgi:hypothetical protein